VRPTAAKSRRIEQPWEDDVEQAQIDKIVAKVVARLQERMFADLPRQQVLILFSGASTGYLAGMDLIRMLAQAGHGLTVFMTASAMHVIGEENVRKAGAQEIFGPDQWVPTPALIRAIDLVVVPTLSMNTAGRLALGLMDSLFSTLVLGALLADKPVIAVCDGADPYGKGGEVFSEQADSAPALRAHMAGNLSTLIDYGINLVPADKFVASVIREMRGDMADPVAAVAPQVQYPGGNGRSKFLTVTDLNMVRPGSTLRLPVHSRLTPLAQDYARQQNLNLVFER
jgi:hypothetical protein